MIAKFKKENESGIALMMTLWIMVLLIAIVTEFSFTMRTEVNITRNTKEDVQAYYLALAGYNRAIGEIIENQNYWLQDGRLFFGKAPSIRSEMGDIYEERRPIKREAIPLGPGSFSYTIETESSKANINYIQRGEWKERLKNSGVEDENLIDTIINGIEDWKDKDTDLHRDTSMPGEDEDYLSEEVYMDEKGLEYPYESKDGNFDCVEELLLIRGMTPEILYGSGYSEMWTTDLDDNGETNYQEQEEGYTGIYDQLTVYNLRGVDINLASRETLEAMAPYNRAAMKRLEDMDSGLLDEEIPSSRPTNNEIFTIISSGFIEGSAVQRTIRAVVKKTYSPKGSRITIIRWDDDYFPKKKSAGTSEDSFGTHYRYKTDEEIKSNVDRGGNRKNNPIKGMGIF